MDGQAVCRLRHTSIVRPILAIATLPSPDGPYHLAASEHGVVAADWGIDRDGFERRLAHRFADGVEPATPDDDATARLHAILPDVEAVLDGAPVDLTTIPLDLGDRPAFDRAVLLAVQDVPWGRTASYGEIARRVGAPRAARAVGGAVGRNPISRLVPCHRIIASDGTIGGYGGDGPADRATALDHKRALLLREGVTVYGRAR